jgi:hypothetical protein
MRKCKCEVLERISNGNTTFIKGDVAMVQFYKVIDTCDVWEIKTNKDKMTGVVTGVSKLKVRKLKQ